jgi:hypothetical protein
MSDNQNKSAANPFDPKRLAVSQTGGENFGSKKLMTTLAIRKPSPKEWVWANSSEDYFMPAALFDDGEGGLPYILVPEIAELYPSEIRYVGLRLAVNRQGVPFLWRHPLLDPNGRENAWNTSHRTAILEAQSGWIRMASNRNMGAYDVHVAPNITAEPVWPEYTLGGLLEIAFASRLISDPQHILLRQLRGEA